MDLSEDSVLLKKSAFSVVKVRLLVERAIADDQLWKDAFQDCLDSALSTISVYVALLFVPHM